jgi:hypothetical protein
MPEALTVEKGSITMATYVAVEAGEAAVTADLTGEPRSVVEWHRELIELTRSSFTLARMLFGLMLTLRGSLHLRVDELRGVLPWGEPLCFTLSDSFG